MKTIRWQGVVGAWMFAIAATARAASGLVGFPDDDDLLRAVQGAFPDDYVRGSTSENDALGFVFDPQLAVVRAGRLRKVVDEEVVASIEQQLDVAVRSRMRAAGGTCFDGVEGRHGRFCVEWVVLR